LAKGEQDFERREGKILEGIQYQRQKKKKGKRQVIHVRLQNRIKKKLENRDS